MMSCLHLQDDSYIFKKFLYRLSVTHIYENLRLDYFFVRVRKDVPDRRVIIYHVGTTAICIYIWYIHCYSIQSVFRFSA